MGSERYLATTLMRVADRPIAIQIRGFALVIQSGPRAGTTIRGDKRSLLIGTHASADVVLEDPLVSRLHARLDVEADDCVLRDLGSTNGTRINGVRIRAVCLDDGAEIDVGGTKLVFKLVDEPFEIQLAQEDKFEGLLGNSVAMRELFALCARVAPTDAPVIIQGETGTGKDLVARAIHRRSLRQDKPFVVLDCAAIPPNLIESELFGHEKGSFTGATATRTGVFERAEGGTVFLDELGELAIELQPKLLRCLETGVITRVGGEKPIEVDFRAIAATNRDLPRMITENRFRADLFYRLAVIRLVVPSLRERREDIPLLAGFFMRQALRDAPSAIPAETLDVMFGELTRHDWPGNVRELRNVVERAAILADPKLLRAEAMDAAAGELQRSIEKAVHKQMTLRAAKTEREREYLTDLLRATEGNLDEAARIAEVHRKSLERLIRRHKLR
ncbi:MAG: sigma 54-interacting transcriptional regulator [Kofleriaceae bacterium]